MRHSTQIKIGIVVLGILAISGLIIGLVGLGGYGGPASSLLMMECGFGGLGVGSTLVGLVIGYLVKARAHSPDKGRLTDSHSPTITNGKETTPDISHPDDELYNVLVREWIDPLPQENRPVAIILNGGSGVGKSTLRDRITRLSSRKFMVLDSDVIKERMPDYHRLLQQGDPDAATSVHERSAEIRRQLMETAFQQRKCIIIDSTGADESFWLFTMQEMKANNYEIGLIRIEVSIDIAWKRCQQRAINGRNIPEDTMRQFHTRSAAAFPALKKAADWWAVYENNTSFALTSCSSQKSEMLTLLENDSSSLSPASQ